MAIFQQHGGQEAITPLLSPYVAHHQAIPATVRLMTYSGTVVTLPYDLRVPLVKHLTLAGRTRLRSYSVGRVYSEKKLFNSHPRQGYECGFDIITPAPSLMADSELISIAYCITNEIAIAHKNVSFRLNHTSLLQACLLYCNVPVDKYDTLLATVQDLIDGKLSRFQVNSTLTGILQNSRQTPSQLLEVMMSQIQLGVSRISTHGGTIKSLLKNRNPTIASLASKGLTELEKVAECALHMGVKVGGKKCS